MDSTTTTGEDSEMLVGIDPEWFLCEIKDASTGTGCPEAQVWEAGVRTAYLAGPMRGYVDFNYPLFNAVAKELHNCGYEIENPAQTDAAVQERADAAKHPLSVYMERDLADVAKTDAVFVLPGWESSEGAKIEVNVAFMLGHPVYTLPEFERVERPILGDWAFTQGPVSPARTQTMPADSADRKATPLVSGVLDYFPAALAEVARVSKYGNDKHNPGEPLHWSRNKSADHADAIGRHLIDRGEIDPETGMSHTAELAWRALALLQVELEAEGNAPMARGASES